jgi:hypothetical protein
MRIVFSLALAMFLAGPPALLQAGAAGSRPAQCQNVSAAARSSYPQEMLAASVSPTLRFSSDKPFVRTSLAFAVSVCLDDFEYSTACRERSSLAAAQRLEQLYLDDYAAGRVAGTLNIWFAVTAERSEQLDFLREVEDRAIESVTRKLKDDVDRVQKWRADASMEARSGTNWSHDWGSRTHLYKPGPALDELVRIGNRNRQGN